jgi:hypothetical protein
MMRLPVQLRTRTPRVNPITEIVDSDGKVIAVVLTPQIGPAIVAAINHADKLEAALREARPLVVAQMMSEPLEDGGTLRALDAALAAYDAAKEGK